MIEQKDSYLGNANIKKDGVTEEWTQDKVLEYAKCMKDPSYFTRKYVKIISLDSGLVDFNLYPYQEEMFKQFSENRFNIVLAARQSGKTIGVVAYLLWYALFHSEKTVAILANKRATALEILSRITLALENIPYFLQPGCRALNKGNIDFSNNTTILAASTSNSSIRGKSVNLLYLDEFAFVERDATFYTSTYPVITAGKTTKVIITSTANGIGNMFHKIWEGALQGTNSYKPFRIDWWDVPGRDDKWREETIANTSPRQFDQEMGNTFFGTGDTLINAETLMSLRAKEPIKVLDGDSVRIYEEPVKGHEYIMLVDVSKGRGQDYSTFNLIDISQRPFKQVAVYRNNTISPILFPNVLYKYAKTYNEAYVVIEANDQGAVVCNGLYYDLEYEEVHVSSAVKANSIGVEMNRKTKRIGCSGFKDLIESNKIEIVDEHTILEISTFVAKGQSYEASDGNHDDLVMNLVMLGYFMTTSYFEDRTNINIKDLMFKQKMKEIEDDVLPFGFIDDGLGNIPQAEQDEWSIQDGMEGVFAPSEW